MDVYEDMEERTARRRGLLTAAGTQMSYYDVRDGKSYRRVKVGMRTERQWVGPPKTFADAERGRPVKPTDG